VSAPSTIIIDVVLLFVLVEVDPADMAWWGRGHAPIKSRRTPPTGDERHNTSKSSPPADSLKESQLAGGRELLLGVGRHRPPIQTASLKAAARRDRRDMTAGA
jgi:hypothetical protein